MTDEAAAEAQRLAFVVALFERVYHVPGGFIRPRAVPGWVFTIRHDGEPVAFRIPSS